ncbi:MAG: cytochrome-c peroxidase [Azoarcus sp.]|jgi:cytochrome c peroxidase|nr:cytochrome-c peroxidase [Azoarcus sp.]
MMKKDQLHFLFYVLLTVLAIALIALIMLPTYETPAPPTEDIVSRKTTNFTRAQASAILPIPQEEPLSSKAQLGEKLFYDPRLSGDGTVSCATCHDLARAGADGRKLGVGVGGALGAYNTPTTFNSVFNFRQFWDGRAADLVEQITGPLTNVAEMASSWAIAVHRVSEDSDYKEAFKREYGGEISEKTIANAIMLFESSLLSPNSPFDRFLNGDADAISSEAKEGYRHFVDYGCISCHQGINIGGNFFQRFGVMGNYFSDRGNTTPADLGRYNITKQEKDRYIFKVPSLRNVAVTAPYFHDGSVDSLDQVIEIMARYQLGRELPEKERRHLVAFLESLTGEYRGERLKP